MEHSLLQLHMIERVADREAARSALIESNTIVCAVSACISREGSAALTKWQKQLEKAANYE
jgi:hypothetical protein